MQLAEVNDELNALGVKVAAMTYDPIDTLRGFATEHALPYPLLADEKAAHVRAFGVLNEQYEPGHRAYGVPHPGLLLIDRDGVVQLKFAEVDYRSRPVAQDVLQAVREWAAARP